MPRIISSELNKKLRREYRLRFFSLLFFILSIVVIVSTLFLFSSHFLLEQYEKAYALEANDRKGEEVTKLNENFNTNVLQVHSLVQKIPAQSQAVDIKIINILFEYAHKDINITAVEILSGAESNLVTIRGTALTRDSLLQFQNTINNNQNFKDFKIPIEALTKQKDISFNVNFTYNEN